MKKVSDEISYFYFLMVIIDILARFLKIQNIKDPLTLYFGILQVRSSVKEGLLN